MSPKTQSQPISAHITVNTPLIPAINAWKYFLSDQGRSIHTIKAFFADLHLLANYMPPDRSLGDISTTDLNNFLEWMQKGRGIPCSPKTLSRRITSLKAFFRWLHEYGVLLIDPAEKVLQRTVTSPLPVVLTPIEIQTILQVAENHQTGKNPDARYAALVGLLLQTGIKKSECLSINVNHIDLEAPNGAMLFVRYASPRHRFKERKIDLSEQWVDIYHSYKEQYQIKELVFPWSPRRLEYLLEDLSREAGLEKHLSFEMSRWTCALTDWQAEMEPEKIRQKLGISKIQWREVSIKLRQLADQSGR